MLLPLTAPGTPDRPKPASHADVRRWEHSALRFDMLQGSWEHHLQLALMKHISAQRRAAWGIPDMSSCLFSSIVNQLAGPLYDSAPAVSGAGELEARVDEAELWPLMQDHAVNLVGLREVGMRLDYDPDNGRLTYRPILPFDLVVKGHRHQRHEPVATAELQLLERADGECEWVWEVLSVEDPAAPVHRMMGLDDEGGLVDRTAELMGSELSGDAYPWRWTQGPRAGKPFIPVVVHHARRQARMWDAWRGAEVVFGSLTVGVLQTMFVHTFRDSSFPTSHAIGLEPRGVTVAGGGTASRIASIEADPGSTHIWDVDPDLRAQPQLLQLPPGGDIEKMAAALEAFRASISEFAGVSPADIQRRSGDPRSGYAISISQAGLRASQRRIEPQLRRGDLAVLERSAAVLNLAEGTSLPESGLGVVYPAVPKSPEERAAEREDQGFRLDRGLSSPVDVFLERNPGMTREAVIAELDRIREERRRFEAAVASPMPRQQLFGADRGGP